MNDQDFKYDETQPLTANVYTKQGYTFKGWDTNPTGTTVVYTNRQSVSNITSSLDGEVNLYAVWQANTNTAYQVEVWLKDAGKNTYTKDEGSSFTNHGTTDSIASFAKPLISGFHVDETKTTYQSTGHTASTSVLTIAADGSLVVNLYYVRDTHSVTYSYTDAIPTGAPNVPVTKQYEYGVDVTVASSPTLAGYDFSGWNKTDFTMGDQDVTISGSWTELQATVNYDTNNENGTITTTTETIGKVTGSPDGSTATANTGYHFAGWYVGETKVSDNPTFTPTKDGTTGLFEEATYTAHFEPDTDTAYTVEYWMHDVTGTGYTLLTTATENRHGTTEDTATVPSKTFDGFTYESTTYESTDHTASSTELKIAADGSLVVKVYYTRNTYTVTFKEPIEGGSLTATNDVMNQDVVYGGSPKGDVTVTAANDEYAWLGFQWVTKDDSNNVIASGTVGIGDAYKSLAITGNTTLTPYFAHIPFVAISTPDHGYVAVSQGTEVPTTIDQTSDTYEWPMEGGVAKDVALAFKAEEHYKISSITVKTPNGTDHTEHTIQLPTTYGVAQDFSGVTANLVEESGTAFITLTNATEGFITLTDVSLSSSFVVNYERITHEVTFDSNEGTSVDDQTVNDGSKVTVPTNPTRDGYMFGGWFLDDDTFENAYNFDTEVLEDVELHAKWTEDQVTITYTKNNEHGIIDNTSEELGKATGTAVGSTATANTGYKFTGWYQGTSLVTTNAKMIPATVNHLNVEATYTAHFEPIQYKVIFDKNSASAIGTMANEEFAYDETKNLTTNAFSNEGYHFIGWSTTSEGSVEYEDAKSVQNLTTTDGSEVKLYAVWEANTDTAFRVDVYCKDLDANTYTKDTVHSSTYEGKTADTAMYTAPSITGFHQWVSETTYQDSSTTTPTKTELTIASDGSLVISLYYLRDDHSVTYQYTGTVPTGAPSVPTQGNVEYGDKFTVDSSISTAVNGSVNGYTFSGWSQTGEVTMGENNIVLTGSWTEQEITIQYTTNNDHGSLTKTSETLGKVTGTPVGSIASPKQGYAFDGWYVGDTKVSDNPAFIPSKNEGVYENATYTAHFIARDDTAYTVEYYLQDQDLGGYTKKASATENSHGTTDTTATIPSKTFVGFTYANTTYEDTNHAANSTELMIADDGTLVVKVYYTRKSYTVEFVTPSEGGTLTADVNVKNQTVGYEGSPIGEVIVEANDSEHYAWLGYQWETIDDNGIKTTGSIGTGDAYKSFEVMGNTKLTPYFAHIPFAAIASTGNGYVAVQQGTTIPTVGTKTTDVYEWPLEDAPARDVVLAFQAAPHYKILSITVATPNGDTTEPVAIPLPTEFGSDHAVDFSSYLPHLISLGGSADLVLIDECNGYITVTNADLSTNFVVNYEIIQHEVSYESNGGSTVSTQTVNDGDPATSPSNPTKNGYIFEGWYSDPTFTTEYDFTTPVTSDLTLYAKWTELEATITYTTNSTNGSVSVSTETIGKEKGDPTGSKATADTGYTFIGWYMGEDLVTTDATIIPTKDAITGLYETATYVAHFRANTYEIVFDPNSTSASGTMDNQSLKYNEAQSLTANAYTNSGYTFKGWSTSDSATSPKYTDGQSVQNLSNEDGSTVTLYAVWEVNQDTPYKVNVYLQDIGETTYTLDGTDSFGKKGATNTEATYTAPTLTGFTLETDQTTYEDSTHSASSDSLKITGDGSLVISLYYSRHQHSVTYQYVGTVPTGVPSVPSQEDVAFGDTFTVDSSISTAENGVIDGYTFLGWSQTGSVTMQDEDIVLEGSWIENGDTPYTVEHYVQKSDGTYGLPKDVEHLTGKTNASVTASQKTYTGYTFDSTNSIKEGTILGNGSLVLKLYYVENAYEIKFDANATSAKGTMANQAMKYDTPAKLNANAFTNAGYQFLGWSSTQSSTTAEFKNQEEVTKLSSTEGSIVTLYAVWQKCDPMTFETPVHVEVTEDTPSDPSTFTFEMTAISTDVEGMTSLPMPNGVTNQSVNVNTIGSGSVGFGNISFTQPGKYVYEICEIDGGLDGYTYDQEVYTITYEITQDETGLHGTCVITKKDGSVVDSASFINAYQKPTETTNPNNPSSNTPDTSDHSPIVWNLFLAMFSLVSLACMILVRKKYTD